MKSTLPGYLLVGFVGGGRRRGGGRPGHGGTKVFPIGLAVVVIAFALSACGTFGAANTSGTGQTLRDGGQTMTTNAGVMRNSGQMLLDNG